MDFFFYYFFFLSFSKYKSEPMLNLKSITPYDPARTVPPPSMGGDLRAGNGGVHAASQWTVTFWVASWALGEER